MRAIVSSTSMLLPCWSSRAFSSKSMFNLAMFVMPFPVIICTMIALASVMKENDDRLMIGYFKA